MKDKKKEGWYSLRSLIKNHREIFFFVIGDHGAGKRYAVKEVKKV